MGLERLCERCGSAHRVWHHDMYGPFCRQCYNSGTPPSEKQKKDFDEACEKIRVARELLEKNEK